MIQVIRSSERHKFENEWLTTHWHFSFDTYNDQNNMNFGPLRVFNDDSVAPGGGFPFHGHREMEIVTYVIDGALEHRDDMGNTGIIRPGEIQRMSAGTGVRHSEFNPSEELPVHFLQLWIMPAVQRLKPSWEQMSFSQSDKVGKLLPIAMPDGSPANGGVRIHQNATVYTSLLTDGKPVEQPLGEGRCGYAFVIGGNLRINGENLASGDQARIRGERDLNFSAVPNNGSTGADFLFLDLPLEMRGQM
jgi:redox-sensitive bicupin YhaK (pirin superfamily)